MSDSLELWATSRAMNCPITVVMESNIFLTALDSPDFGQLTFMLDSYSTAFLCKQEELEDTHVPGPSGTEPRRVGHPLIQDQEVTSMMSSDTDCNTQSPIKCVG